MAGRKKAEKYKADTMFLKSWRRVNFRDECTVEYTQKSRKGVTLVVVPLGVREGDKPFPILKAFDDLARANGYAKQLPPKRRGTKKGRK